MDQQEGVSEWSNRKGFTVNRKGFHCGATGKDFTVKQ